MHWDSHWLWERNRKADRCGEWFCLPGERLLPMTLYQHQTWRRLMSHPSTRGLIRTAVTHLSWEAVGQHGGYGSGSTIAYHGAVDKRYRRNIVYPGNSQSSGKRVQNSQNTRSVAFSPAACRTAMEQWIKGAAGTVDKRCGWYWIGGPTGSGKTLVATVQCRSRRQLSAFFCSRGTCNGKLHFQVQKYHL